MNFDFLHTNPSFISRVFLWVKLVGDEDDDDDGDNVGVCFANVILYSQMIKFHFIAPDEYAKN